MTDKKWSLVGSHHRCLWDLHGFLDHLLTSPSLGNPATMRSAESMRLPDLTLQLHRAIQTSLHYEAPNVQCFVLIIEK